MGKEQFYRTMYRMKKITAAGVWEKVDEGELTKAQALRICGPRPKEALWGRCFIIEPRTKTRSSVGIGGSSAGQLGGHFGKNRRGTGGLR